MLEKEIDFINKDECLLTFSTVLCNTVQNRVEDDKHTDRHKLFAEVKNVIADKAVTLAEPLDLVQKLGTFVWF